MINIQIIKDPNSANLERGVYAQWLGNALSDSLAQSLLDSGEAVSTTDPNSVKDVGFSKTRSTNIGTRIFGGKSELVFDNTSAFTWESTFTVPADYDRVRFIFNNVGLDTVTEPAMLATVASVEDSTDATLNAATWQGLQVSSSGAWTLTKSASGTRRSYVVSDWLSLASVPRTDGGRGRLVSCRAWVNGGTLGLLGDAGDTVDYQNWLTKPDGYIFKTRRKAGNLSATSADWSSATASNNTPILGVQYMSRGKVITVATCGDSIAEGNSTYRGDGYAYPAINSLNRAGKSYDYMNLSWSGASSPTILTNIEDAITAGIIPDVLIINAGTANDNAEPIVDANITSSRTFMSRILALCQDNQIIPVITTQPPVNTAVKNYGSSDSKRVALNTSILSDYSSFDVVDFSTIISGKEVSDQVQIVEGLTDDGIHPNDTGNDLLTNELKQTLQKFI